MEDWKRALEIKYLVEFKDDADFDERYKEFESLKQWENIFGNLNVFVTKIKNVYLYTSSIQGYRQKFSESKEDLGKWAFKVRNNDQLGNHQLIGISEKNYRLVAKAERKVSAARYKTNEGVVRYIRMKEIEFEYGITELTPELINSKVEEIIQDLKKQKKDVIKEEVIAEAQKKKREKEEIEKAKQELKGNQVFRYVTVKDGLVITNNDETKDDSITFNKKHLIVNGKLINSNSTTIHVSSDGIKHIFSSLLNCKENFTYTNGKKTVKAKFDNDKIMVNGLRLSKGLYRGIIDRYIKTDGTESLEEIKKVYNKLGVKKRLLVDMQETRIGEVGAKGRSFKLKIKINPIDKTTAEMTICGVTKTVMWEKLLKTFMYGNSIYHPNSLYNKLLDDFEIPKQNILEHLEELMVAEAL